MFVVYIPSCCHWCLIIVNLRLCLFHKIQCNTRNNFCICEVFKVGVYCSTVLHVTCIGTYQPENNSKSKWPLNYLLIQGPNSRTGKHKFITLCIDIETCHWKWNRNQQGKTKYLSHFDIFPSVIFPIATDWLMLTSSCEYNVFFCLIVFGWLLMLVGSLACCNSTEQEVSLAESLHRYFWLHSSLSCFGSFSVKSSGSCFYKSHQLFRVEALNYAGCKWEEWRESWRG